MSNVDTVSTDVLIIGVGPSGLATAIHLADTFKQKRQNHRIGIIAYVAYHYLNNRINKLVHNWEYRSVRFLDLINNRSL